MSCHYLCASLSRMKSGLIPISVYVGLAVAEVTMGEISLPVILLSTVSIIPLTLYTFTFHSPATNAT